MITKLDMARVIVTALYNMPKLAPEDHFHVKRLVKWKKEILRDHHNHAITVIQQQLRRRETKMT